MWYSLYWLTMNKVLEIIMETASERLDLVTSFISTRLNLIGHIVLHYCFLFFSTSSET